MVDILHGDILRLVSGVGAKPIIKCSKKKMLNDISRVHEGPNASAATSGTVLQNASCKSKF